MRLTIRALVPSLAVAALLTACGGKTTTTNPSGDPSAISKTAGDNQSAVVGTSLTAKPTVKVVDADGVAVSGVTVTFAVTSGGGTVTGASVKTGGTGTAVVGGWTLGTSAGTNTLSATITGTAITGNPASFTATGTAGSAKTLTKTAGDNQTSAAGLAVASTPTVKVVDQYSNPVAGVSVTFAVATGGGSVTSGTSVTNAAGLATVGSWVLGATAGANTLTATATGSGITGNPATFTATGTGAPSFNPSSNANLSGVQTYSSVNIPAGVTITATSDLTLNVTGAVTIAGTLVGSCVNINVIANGVLTLSGAINNSCTGSLPADLPAMLLVGKGGYTLNGVVTAAGDFEATDDQTATDNDFTNILAPSMRANQAAGVPCNVGAGFVGTAVPGTMTPNNVAGNPNGVDGGNGKQWILWCKGGGDMTIGLLSLTGQAGGKGGDGTHTNATAAASRGGKGGNGGPIKIQSKGNLTIAGGTISTGGGGAGGSATATGTGNGGSVGASATSTGGNGGTPGLFTATASGTLNIAGALTLAIGNAGRGGDAIATAGDGHDGAVSCTPATGGPSSATAGNGGSTPDKTLRGTGALTGLNNVTVSGGVPGNGGNATSTAGKGGDGAAACKDGANGGAPYARGGDGGNGDLKNQAGVKVSNGGNGGNMTDIRGNGGLGWSDCILPNWVPGGKGGDGGNSQGINGSGGTGLSTGSYGSATFNGVSNGANGGNGFGPGAGGIKGQNNALLVNTSAIIVPTSFTDGIPGLICVGTATKTFIVDPPSQDLSGHEPVLLQAGTRPGDVTNGSGASSSFSVTGLIKNSTIVMNGTRTGTAVSLTGSGVINTGSGPRNATITFTGTISSTGLNGTLSILIAGFPNPAVYAVHDP